MSIDDPNAPRMSDGGTSPQSPVRPLEDDLGGASEHGRHDLNAAAQRVKDDARDLGHQASEKIAEATDKTKSFAADQKDLAAGQVSGVAAAINKVADELDGSDQQTIARYARDLAGGLSSLGKTIEDRDVDDLMGLAQDYGRKQPVAFMGAAALAGFVASRFALASAHRRDTKPTASTNVQSDGPTAAYGAPQPNPDTTGGL